MRTMLLIMVVKSESSPTGTSSSYPTYSTVLTRISSVLSTHAISGIPRGHQVEVNTWYDAATLYNSLLDQGLITRVRM